MGPRQTIKKSLILKKYYWTHKETKTLLLTINATVLARWSGVMKSTLPNHFMGPASAKSRLLEVPKPFFALLNGTSDSE